MPQIESSGGGAENGGRDDLFEDALEDALCVFVSGDSNQDIIEKNKKLIMFYIDLENEQIYDENGEESKEGDMEMASEGKHPVLLNTYPLCPHHSLFLMFADAGLPQVLSDELLLLMLQIFKVSDNESLRIGYNSMGADCIANNLHFHLMYAESMFTELGEDQGRNQ